MNRGDSMSGQDRSAPRNPLLEYTEEGKREGRKSRSTSYPGWVQRPLHRDSWRCWQAQARLPGMEDVGGKDYLQPTLVHATCFRLKQLFCDRSWRASEGNPCRQRSNLSFFSCFSVSTSNINSGPHRCARQQASPHCAPANIRPPTAFLKRVSCYKFFWYFGTSLWQTQLKFQLINQTASQPINTDLGTQLLSSRGLLQLCVPSLQKSPLSPKPSGTESVTVLARVAESTSSEKGQAPGALSRWYYCTRKYVSTRTKPKPCNKENARIRDVLAEEVFFFFLVLGHVCYGKWEAREESTTFLSRHQDCFPQQNISDSFPTPPSSLQPTENSVWKRNWERCWPQQSV